MDEETVAVDPPGESDGPPDRAHGRGGRTEKIVSRREILFKAPIGPGQKFDFRPGMGRKGPEKDGGLPDRGLFPEHAALEPGLRRRSRCRGGRFRAMAGGKTEGNGKEKGGQTG